MIRADTVLGDEDVAVLPNGVLIDTRGPGTRLMTRDGVRVVWGSDDVITVTGRAAERGVTVLREGDTVIVVMPDGQRSILLPDGRVRIDLPETAASSSSATPAGCSGPGSAAPTTRGAGTTRTPGSTRTPGDADARGGCRNPGPDHRFRACDLRRDARAYADLAARAKGLGATFATFAGAVPDWGLWAQSAGAYERAIARCVEVFGTGAHGALTSMSAKLIASAEHYENTERRNRDIAGAASGGGCS